MSLDDLKKSIAETRREEEEAIKHIPGPRRRWRKPKDTRELVIWYLDKLNDIAANGFGGNRFKSGIQRLRQLV